MLRNVLIFISAMIIALAAPAFAETPGTTEQCVRMLAPHGTAIRGHLVKKITSGQANNWQAASAQYLIFAGPQLAKNGCADKVSAGDIMQVAGVNSNTPLPAALVYEAKPVVQSVPPPAQAEVAAAKQAATATATQIAEKQTEKRVLQETQAERPLLQSEANRLVDVDREIKQLATKLSGLQATIKEHTKQLADHEDRLDAGRRYAEANNRWNDQQDERLAALEDKPTAPYNLPWWVYLGAIAGGLALLGLFIGWMQRRQD
jgi:hypothetical protein